MAHGKVWLLGLRPPPLGPEAYMAFRLALEGHPGATSRLQSYGQHPAPCPP